MQFMLNELLQKTFLLYSLTLGEWQNTYLLEPGERIN